MGVRWSRANIIDDLEQRIKTAGPAAMKSVNSDLEHLAEQSAQEMQQYISSRGTEKSGKAGRIDSETMINAVGFRKAPQSSATAYLWEFGWIEEFEKYFHYQEDGFKHVGGEMVPGMFALKDAAQTAKDKLQELAPKIIEKAVAHIKGRG